MFFETDIFTFTVWCFLLFYNTSMLLVSRSDGGSINMQDISHTVLHVSNQFIKGYVSWIIWAAVLYIRSTWNIFLVSETRVRTRTKVVIVPHNKIPEENVNEFSSKKQSRKARAKESLPFIIIKIRRKTSTTLDIISYSDDIVQFGICRRNISVICKILRNNPIQ